MIVPSYIPPFLLNQCLTGGVVGIVVQSKNNNFKSGDIVLGHLDWADYSTVNGIDLQKINPNDAPIRMGFRYIRNARNDSLFWLLLDIDNLKQEKLLLYLELREQLE